MNEKLYGSWSIMKDSIDSQGGSGLTKYVTNGKKEAILKILNKGKGSIDREQRFAIEIDSLLLIILVNIASSLI